MPGTGVTMIDPNGDPHTMSEAEASLAERTQGFKRETPIGHEQRLSQEATDEYYGSGPAQVAAGIAATLRGGTLGGSDVLARGIYGEGGARTFAKLKEANPTTSTVGELAGALVTAIPTGGESLAAAPAAQVAKLGARIARTGEEAGTLAKIARGAAGGSAEGGLYGLGSGVSELALSDDPLTLEHAASVLSSHALYGVAIGAGAGTLAKGAEIGLSKARGAIEAATVARQAESNIAPELSDMVARGDVKGLSRARDAELESIETGRVTERKAIADDVKAMRDEAQQTRAWHAIEGSPDKEIRTIGKQLLDADKPIRNLLDNPKYLAENPKSALRGLQEGEHAYEEMLRVEPKIRASFAADETVARATALDSVPSLLEKNRAIQARIRDVTAEPASARLTAIADAKDVLTTRAAQPKSIGESVLGGVVYGAVSGPLHGIPVLGHILGPLAGARVSQLVTDKVFGRLGAAAGEASAKVQKTVAAFLDPAAKATKYIPPIASKTLASVRYAPEQPTPRGTPEKKPTQLHELYAARASELRSQTAYDETGTPRMRPEARQAVADQLKGIAAGHPVMADRIETNAVARIEFLASKLPRKPEIAGMQIGPDNWRPSDMAMRTFARYAAAVEDPHGVIERLVHGAVTPEDAEAMRAVYPAMMADVQRQIIEGLPMLQKTLPYQRKLALSIFSGIAVDPSMDPRILSVLQAQHVVEEGTAGGTQAPRAQPQFGSVSKPKPTPAQERAG